MQFGVNMEVPTWDVSVSPSPTGVTDVTGLVTLHQSCHTRPPRKDRHQLSQLPYRRDLHVWRIVTMSEQDPLLPSQTAYNDADIETNDNDKPKHGWRHRMAEFLESTPMHYTVLALACISPFHSS